MQSCGLKHLRPAAASLTPSAARPSPSSSPPCRPRYPRQQSRSQQRLLPCLQSCQQQLLLARRKKRSNRRAARPHPQQAPPHPQQPKGPWPSQPIRQPPVRLNRLHPFPSPLLHPQWLRRKKTRPSTRNKKLKQMPTPNAAGAPCANKGNNGSKAKRALAPANAPPHPPQHANSQALGKRYGTRYAARLAQRKRRRNHQPPRRCQKRSNRSKPPPCLPLRPYRLPLRCLIYLMHPKRLPAQCLLLLPSLSPVP